ncbi:MAG: NUDIX domain-containing protein [Lachnospiraceae bacterium]|nr:NUDIX domain-containing protein [Lachnospiraceae bacterium]
MEIFDIVDEYGKPTGETIERGLAHKEGVRHRTAHIWIAREVNGKWQVLLQKRAQTKDSFPGRYDTSSAGHIQAGDEPLESAIRELQEELGIVASPEELKYAGTFNIKYEKEFHNKLFKDNEIAFVYVYLGEIDIDDIIVQEEELECVEWFDLEETYTECLAHNQKFCVPVKGLETARQYLDSMNK